MKTLVVLCLLLTCVCGLSSHGNDFYIGALRNYRGLTDTLYLYVMTQSSSPVGVTVEDYNGVIATGNVTNMNLLKLNLSTNLVTNSNNYNNRHKGIRVYTDGGMISVLLFNYQSNTIGEYLAYPVQKLQNVSQYQYYAVSTLFQIGEPLQSEVLLIGTDNNTTVTVTSPVDLLLPQNIQLSSSPNMTVTAGSSFNFTIHRMQTLLIGMSDVDITGTSITSDIPLTVISGHECSFVPSNVWACQHFTVQIPPTVKWGKQFLLSPYGSKPTQYYKIIASESQTTFSITCGNGSVITISLSGAGDYRTLSAAGNDSYCSIVSNKPISVYQLGAGYQLGNIGDPVISYIPPIDQFSSSTIFVSPNTQNLFTSHYINIVATSLDTVILDGTQLTLSDGWNAIYDDTNNVIGHGTQVQLNTTDTPRTIITQSNTKFYVLVYGYGEYEAYSYVAGFDSSNVVDNIECLPECENDGTCISENACACTAEWNGDSCQYPICSPECLNGNCTSPDNCTCDSGWTGDSCNIDINECGDDNGGCDQTCTNTIGSYYCSCDDGYNTSYDGLGCDNVNECLIDNGGCHHQCVDSPGSFHCLCYTGYQYSNNQSSICEDINECVTGNSGCNHDCTNINGSYYCTCYSSGYHLLQDGVTCQDINECSNSSLNSCNQSCSNNIGSYNCFCYDGYILQLDGYSCNDINECTMGISGCSHGCMNIIGSYVCSCPSGYDLLPNNRTCNDINECHNDNGGCQHICINEIGSYHCECQDGFSLSSDTSCTADLCTTIFGPLSGDIYCPNGQITGETCSFSCSYGYQLMGSDNRTCLPDHTWTGNVTSCHPLQCDILSSTYGMSDPQIVVVPCDNIFNSTCNILCNEGYHLSSDISRQTCVITSPGTVAWSSKPNCSAIHSCSPNPCLHLGTCLSNNNNTVDDDDGTSFKCDCAGTLYTGDKCQIGLIQIPPIQPVMQESNSITISIKAFPKEPLTINIISTQSAFKKTITMLGNQTQADVIFQIQSASVPANIFLLEYQLSYDGVGIFKPPDSSIILIKAEAAKANTNANGYFDTVQTTSPYLKPGCCFYNYSFSSCSNVHFTSLCLWKDTESIVSTDGVVFINNQGLYFPLSIAGVNISESTDENSINSVTQFSNCLPCSSSTHDSTSCYDGQFTLTSDKVEPLLTYRSLLSTFFQATSLYYPSYIDISVPSVPANQPFYIYDYTYNLMSVNMAMNVYGCEKLPLPSSGLLYIARSRSDINISIDNNIRRYVTSQSDSFPICYSISMCNGDISLLHVGVPESVNSFITSYSYFQDYIVKGWKFNFNYLSFSTNSFVQDFTGYSFSNGSHFITVDNTLYDFQTHLSITGNITRGSLTTEVEFTGILSYKRHNTGNEVNTIFNGNANFVISTIIDSQRVTLPLYGNTLLLFSHSSAVNYNPPISVGSITGQLNYQHSATAGSTFFSSLFVIPDYTNSCPIHVFLQSNTEIEQELASLTSTCIGIRIGRLEITTNFTHYITFPGVAASASDPSLMIDSFLTTETQSLGNFITVANDNTQAVSLKYQNGEDGVKGTIHNSNVTIFDSMINSDITINGERLTFNGATKIFEYFNVLIRGSFTSQFQWSATPITLFGQIADDYIGELNVYLSSHIEDLVSESINARHNAKLAFTSAGEQLNQLSMLRNDALLDIENKTASFEQLEALVNSLNVTLSIAAEAYNNALSEYNQVETCNISRCEYICVSGTNCTACYNETYIVERGSCPVYVTETESSIEYIPYSTIGWRYEIRSYSCKGVRRQAYSCIPWTRVCYYRACVSYMMYKTFQRVKTITRLVVRNQACEIEVYNRSAPSACCQEYECSYTIPDPNCTLQNELCQSKLDSLGDRGANLSSLYMQYTNAQAGLLVAQLELAAKRVDLTTAMQRLNLIQPAYESAMISYNISESNYKNVLQETTSGYLLNDTGIQVLNITFSLNVLAETPFIFPVQIKYEAQSRNTTTKLSFDYQMNFQTDQMLLKRDISERIVNDFQSNGDSKRKKRLENSKTVFEVFQERCANIQNIADFYDQLLSLLKASLNDSTQSQFFLLNLTKQISSLQAVNSSSSKELSDRYHSFAVGFNNSLDQLVTLIRDNAFPEWQATIQLLLNNTNSAGGSNCFGLTNCLQTTISTLKVLLNDISAQVNSPLLTSLLNIQESIIEVGQSKNLSLEIAITRLATVFEIANSTEVIDYWCAGLPRMTINPELELNISTGGTLILGCKAQSNLPIQYQWKKDSLYIPSQKLSNLTILNMRMEDARMYSCEASTAVGRSNSLESRINVYYAPILNLTLRNAETYEGKDEGINLQCDAHSWPPPGWKWYFRSSDSVQWSEIPGIDANTLPIPDPTSQQEGWYMCEASNWMGTNSSVAYFTVLPVKIVRVKYPVSFELVSNENSFVNLQHLKEEIESALRQDLSLNITVISDLRIDVTNQTYTVTFNLITPNVQFDNVVPMKIEDILTDYAFPMISELEASKVKLEEIFRSNNDSLTIDDDYINSYHSKSLQLGTRAFVCPNGYGLHSNLIFCVGCTQGSFQGPPAVVATDLGNNSYIYEEMPQCLPCPLGTYQNNKTSTECLSCPDQGTTSEAGSRFMSDCIIQCKPGTYSSTGYSPCVPCPDGHYQPLPGGLSCSPCSDNVYNDQCELTVTGTTEQETNVGLIVGVIFGGIFIIICITTLVTIVTIFVYKNVSSSRKDKYDVGKTMKSVNDYEMNEVYINNNT